MRESILNKYPQINRADTSMQPNSIFGDEYSHGLYNKEDDSIIGESYNKIISPEKTKKYSQEDINALKAKREKLYRDYNVNPTTGSFVSPEITELSKIISDYEGGLSTDADRAKSVDDARNKSWRLGIFNTRPTSRPI